MLTQTNVKETFERDGFVVVENLFSAEECALAKDEVRDIFKQLGEKPGNGVYVGLSARNAYFRELNARPQVLDVWEEIFGPNIEFWSDKIVFKSADVDFGSPWHQDYMYWRGANKYSVWIALDDAKPENGCLKFIPGSHRSVVAHDGTDTKGIGFGHRLRPEDVDESKEVVVPARAGTGVFFHDLTLHSSYANKSGRDRWALISTYRDASQDDLHYNFATAAFMARGVKTGRVLEESGR